MKKKGRKFLPGMLCILALSAALAVPLGSIPGTESSAIASVKAVAKKNGLKREKGRYYYYKNGKKVKRCWQTVKGKKILFPKNGAAATLSFKIKGKYYVFNQKGQLIQPSSTKIVKIGKKKYQVKPNGQAKKGWTKNKKNYFYDTGEMAVGTIAIKGKFYCFNSKGTYDKKKTSALQKAAKYEKPLASVKKIIGEPQKSEYSSGGCYKFNGIDGEDGTLTYKNFTVFTFKMVTGEEIFMGVE